MSIARRHSASVGDSIGNYNVESKIGEGTYGTVYKTTYKKLSYAVKVLKLWEIPVNLHEELKKRFEFEYRCGKIDNRHLVTSVDKGEVDGNPFLVMEYCTNGDVENNFAFFNSIPKVKKLAYEILLGLQALHNKGFIHRDLKPGNVLLNSNYTAHLTDFGIAGHLNARITVPDMLGRVKQTFGTYAYIAPEQLKDAKKFKSLGPVTDIFSLGAMIYEILTNGRLPFGEIANQGDLADYIKNCTSGNLVDPKKYNPEIPQDLLDVLNKCLHPDYKTRYQYAGQVIKDLGYVNEAASDVQFEYKTDKLVLTLMRGEEANKIYSISDMLNSTEGFLTIGCTYNGDPNPEKNQVAILENHSQYISNYHATLMKSNKYEGWYIRDGQFIEKNGRTDWHASKNNTYLNSLEVGASWAKLTPGDIITLGDYTLKVDLI